MSSPSAAAISHSLSPARVLAGASVVEITPQGSVFLFGYPHVSRYSTGVHDPLECAALYLRVGDEQTLFLANDLIYFDRDHAREIRERIAKVTGVPTEGIMISATHTHSGPVMTNNLSNSRDSVVPPVDEDYLTWLTERLILAAVEAKKVAQPAELGLVVAQAKGVGSNRHDPSAESDPEVPVLVARSTTTQRPLGCMMVYGMHPTVMHEDSTLISADFPGFTRRKLRSGVLGETCPIVYLLGVAGDQSPRHVTHANTFAEAQRIGELLADTITTALETIRYETPKHLRSRNVYLDLIARVFPNPSEALDRLTQTRARYEHLRATHASRQEVRTAECDVFGAEKTTLFSDAIADGRLDAAIRTGSPAEIQIIQIGSWRFVAWPGEFFVEYGLAVKAKAPPGTFLVTLANGQLQGYIATPKALAQGYYEATNAIFSVDNGPRFVEKTLALLEELS
ncbi:MAG TPA: neutral/alkaline non-lysosomal ceramidase N-terminal domain-containing protein [Opitutaceae bacterium]|nr:neutral/alkaline non-lysosomal ceramidase N-terminal domain-containing protein [Opitutaceae bacterium]